MSSSRKLYDVVAASAAEDQGATEAVMAALEPLGWRVANANSITPRPDSPSGLAELCYVLIPIVSGQTRSAAWPFNILNEGLENEELGLTVVLPLLLDDIVPPRWAAIPHLHWPTVGPHGLAAAVWAGLERALHLAGWLDEASVVERLNLSLVSRAVSNAMRDLLDEGRDRGDYALRVLLGLTFLVQDQVDEPSREFIGQLLQQGPVDRVFRAADQAVDLGQGVLVRRARDDQGRVSLVVQKAALEPWLREVGLVPDSSGGSETDESA